MDKAGIQRKGIILFLVLATIFIVILLGNIILSIISSQSRLTLHKVSRIQAYYAAWAGTNFTLERLRTGAWTYSPINSCPNSTPCLLSSYVQGYAGTFPSTISSVSIIFCPAGTTCIGTSGPCNPPAGNNFCINSTATFTYTP